MDNPVALFLALNAGLILLRCFSAVLLVHLAPVVACHSAIGAVLALVDLFRALKVCRVVSIGQRGRLEGVGTPLSHEVTTLRLGCCSPIEGGENRLLLKQGLGLDSWLSHCAFSERYFPHGCRRLEGGPCFIKVKRPYMEPEEREACRLL